MLLSSYRTILWSQIGALGIFGYMWVFVGICGGDAVNFII